MRVVESGYCKVMAADLKRTYQRRALRISLTAWRNSEILLATDQKVEKQCVPAKATPHLLQPPI
jgi:hypothetical protein